VEAEVNWSVQAKGVGIVLLLFWRRYCQCLFSICCYSHV